MANGNPINDLPFKALGGQPAFRAGSLEPFLNDRRIATLAYVRRDGRPNQAPIWYTLVDGVFYMSTTTGGVKHRALERNPRVSLTIQDERPPYKAVIVDGTATFRDLGEGDDPTAGVATRYFGRAGAAAYDKMTKEIYAETGLTLITVVPTEIKGFDNTQALSGFERAFVRFRESLPLPRTWI